MDDLYMNNSIPINSIAGTKYSINPGNMSNTFNIVNDQITNRLINNDITENNSINLNTNNNTQVPVSESREADISIFKDTENNVPDFFISNVTEEIFLIFIVTAALLASARINNKIITFILFIVISLLISTEYGISIAIVFYAIFFLDTPDIFVIILVILALIHIFLPIPGIVSDGFNWNYVIGIILGILLFMSINNNWRTVFCINNNGNNVIKKNNNLNTFDNDNITY